MASLASQKYIKRARQVDDVDSALDNELFFLLLLTNDNWPRLIVLASASEEKPLSKPSPLAVQKGFQAVAETVRSTKRLRDGSFLVECSRSCLLYTSPSPRDDY